MTDEKSLQNAVLRLFNCVQVDGRSGDCQVSRQIQQRALQNGYLLDGSFEPNDNLLDAIESQIGISGEKANSSFHKSWEKVRTADMRILLVQQIAHYISTYGFESLGVYSNETIYIPVEVLKVPDITDNLPLVVIHGCNALEILEKIKSLAGMGIALADRTLQDIMTVVKANRYDPDYLGDIRNRELLGLLREYYGIVPTDPVEFLRHLVLKLTGISLLIKNKELIGKIKEADNKSLDALIPKAPNDLASVFLRYKPIFLAMKSITLNKAFFNRLRKDAVQLHKPLPRDNLNCVTNFIKLGTLNLEQLRSWLESATVFRKARLAYALHTRTMNGDSILYQIRNGTGWATSFTWTHQKQAKKALNTVLASLARGLKPAVAGRTIYIPEGVGYAIPATEKQFLGNFPLGTYIEVPDNMIVGIYWEDVSGYRVDLDLSGLSQRGKIGWDGAYRSLDDVAAFSGDITSAPHGASEMLWFNDFASPHVLNVNYYNFSRDHPVPARIFVARDVPIGFGADYAVDPNKILAVTNVEFSTMSSTIGLVSSVKGQNRFYFTNVSMGKCRSSSNSQATKYAREFLVRSALNPLDFNSLLATAGAEIVTEKPDNGDFIDLSPSALDRMTIINLLMGISTLSRPKAGNLGTESRNPTPAVP